MMEFKSATYCLACFQTKEPEEFEGDYVTDDDNDSSPKIVIPWCRSCAKARLQMVIQVEEEES